MDSIWKSANFEGLGTTFPKTEAILANVPTTTKTEEVLFVIKRNDAKIIGFMKEYCIRRIQR